MADLTRAVLDRRYADTVGALGRGVRSVDELSRLSDPLRERVLRHRSSLLASLSTAASRDEAARHMARRTERFLHLNAHYARLDAAERAGLVRVYLALVESLRVALRADGPDFGAAVERATRDHLHRLLDHLASAHDHAELLAAATGRTRTVHAAYRPRLQLDVLGITPAELREPILDLGAGARGALVRELARRGLDATGVDHLAGPGPRLRSADWLDFPLEPGQWGTVISHMAFTSHFLRLHRRADDGALRYAARYMEILGSLRVGGSFVYAPSLPFLEPLLPRHRFDVEHHRVPVPGLHDPALSRSTRVTRLA